MKLITACILLLAGACALAMTVCGGIFTATAIHGGWPILVISLPSLALGAFLLRLVFIRLRELFKA